MSRVTNRNTRVLSLGRTSPVGVVPVVSRTDFYREEFLKHKRRLQEQRECFSEHAILEVEDALTKTLARLDHICQQCDCDHVVSCLLRQFDLVTGLSAWSDPKNHH